MSCFWMFMLLPTLKWRVFFVALQTNFLLTLEETLHRMFGCCFLIKNRVIKNIFLFFNWVSQITKDLEEPAGINTAWLCEG